MFDLNATLTNGGTLTGTIDLDLNASNFTSSTADITYTLGDVSSTISGDATALLFEPSAPYATGLSFGSVGDDLSFLVSTPSHASLQMVLAISVLSRRPVATVRFPSFTRRVQSMNSHQEHLLPLFLGHPASLCSAQASSAWLV